MCSESHESKYICRSLDLTGLNLQGLIIPDSNDVHFILENHLFSRICGLNCCKYNGLLRKWIPLNESFSVVVG